MKTPGSKYRWAKFMRKHWPVSRPVLGTQGYQEDPAEGQEMLASDIQHKLQMHCGNSDGVMAYWFSFLTTASWAPSFTLQSLRDTYRQLINVSSHITVTTYPSIKAVRLLSIH